jgi:cyclic-di-GMP-binding protein
MPSFDAALEPNFVELRNAVDQTAKEIVARFDFKGSSAKVDLTEKDAKARELMLYADSDFQIGQVKDILLAKLAKRGVDVRFLDDSAKIEKIGGDKVRQPVKVKVGIDAELGKRIQQAVKQSKLKVQAAIQGDIVRITGAKRDDLQTVIALLRREITDLPIKFENPRD